MIVLHGDNLVQSRLALSKHKADAEAKGLEVIVLYAKSVAMSEVIQALESSSLFGNDKLVIIEGLNKEIADYLKNMAPANVIVWESKKITPAALKNLGGTVQEFKINPEIFALTDGLRPGNNKGTLECFEKAKKQEAVELIFFMISRQMRMLIQAKSDPNSLVGNPFAVSKARKQANSFDLDKLLELYHQLYVIDKNQKTGATPLSLENDLELWLLSV